MYYFAPISSLLSSKFLALFPERKPGQSRTGFPRVRVLGAIFFPLADKIPPVKIILSVFFLKIGGILVREGGLNRPKSYAP